MEAIGILTEVDMAAFAGYCQAYARWKDAEEFISQHGSIVKTPWDVSHTGMKKITITTEDVQDNASFFCEVTI